MREQRGGRAAGWLAIALAAVLIGGCGNKPAAGGQEGGDAPLHSAGGTAATAHIAPEDRGLADAEPERVRALLAEEAIANGDIYWRDGALHVNIVGLTSDIEARFAARFASGTYELHDVDYTIGQLEEAQLLLQEHDLYRKLNLYGSMQDVIGNRLVITMPDASEAKAKPAIERLIDPGMVAYVVEPLGDPHVVGAIAAIEGDQRRVLVLEDGAEEPTYWFSFDDHTVSVDAAGEPLPFESLATGDRVKLWHTGEVLDSLPAQATARRLEAADSSADDLSNDSADGMAAKSGSPLKGR